MNWTISIITATDLSLKIIDCWMIDMKMISKMAFQLPVFYFFTAEKYCNISDANRPISCFFVKNEVTITFQFATIYDHWIPLNDFVVVLLSW